ncbi:MAG TPA: two-component regulator propeller domain-containing protein, partial [Thermoanaerobaculia bacterium]|nr:two-component regulator propeller domain-containing protein [Thermoanaerobaculia bacterium]
MTRFRIAMLSVCALGVFTAGASGAATKIWVSDTATDFSAGEARGVAVGMDGTLILSRQARRVDGVSEASLFATATDKAGNAYLATGDSGRILRVPSNGKPEVVATLKEKEVTALTVGPDGVVYAGGSPGGTVYRVEKGTVVPLYETHARYVWALAVSAGNLYAGTGIPGQIFRITLPKAGAKGEAAGERIHTTADSHVRTLCVDSRGRIWAGTSGSGLVLRIEPSGAVSTVYDSAKGEITSIVAGRDGRMWAAAGSSDVSPASGELVSAPREPPTAKPAKPQTEGGGGGGEPRAEVTVSVSAPRLAPQTTTGTRGGYSSEVLLFDDGEPGRPIWTSNQELVFALEPDGDGSGVLAATGPNGKLYRLGVGRASLERTFDEKQVSTLSADLVGTNAATGVYRMAGGPREGEYVSAVKDTGRTSRFGAFRWEGDVPPGTRLEFAFRSGESATPDTTWSAWSPYAAAKRVDVVAAPGGRYLQYKVRMSSEGSGLPVIRRIEAAYRNRNGAPVVDSLIALGPNEVYARSASGGSNVFESTTPDERGIF